MKTFLLLICFILIANCSVIKLPLIADSWLNSHFPNSNYGSSQYGYCYDDAILSAKYDLVVKANISNVPATMVSASLVFTQESVDPNEAIAGPQIVFTLYEVTSNWTESNVTWNNAPTYINTILPDYQDGDIDFIIAPITSLVTGYKASGVDILSLRLAGGDPYIAVYMMQHTSPGLRPYIKIITS